jgi:PTS system glucitol/sorbitol-specific IIA component
MNSMDIKYDVAITSIGNLAKTFLTNNNSAILLDEGIRPNLSDMVLEHTPGKLEEDIKKGDKLLMGGIKYTIEKVGDAVNENLREEGHCTLVFNAEGSMPGQIILKGPALPVLTVGAHITFTKK